MRWPGVTANLYQRAFPGASMKSRIGCGVPSIRNAFGQESLSRELTRHGDEGVVAGDVIFTVTKTPGFTPATVTLTGAGIADHFILVARTSDDPRRGLTAFLYHRDQPGWRILRRIPIMGPEEHGGHCELVFEGLEIPDENVLLEVGDGLRVTQIRLGPARLTHCMR